MMKRVLGYLPALPVLVVLGLAVFASYEAGAQRIISGNVTDDFGESLIGANVLVADSPGLGTITDPEGNYTLEVPSSATQLSFSYIGYRTQVVDILARAVIDVQLKSDESLLEEVVVVGYGKVAKRDLAGSVDQISEKRITNIPVTSLDQTLAGQVQGLQVRQGSGQPGAGAEILVRGIGSLTGDGNAPLIVIDGVPYGNYNAQTNNFLSLVNPNDIATITVARDAAEKAIYGSRASAGLILITTKRGRSSAKPTVSLNSYLGMQEVPDFERPEILNATELATFLRERIEDAAAARGQEPDIPANLEDPSQYGEGTDWFDLITRNAPLQNVDLSVRGGADRVQYSLSLGYLNQDGVIEESSFKRYSARINLDLRPTDWLNVGFNLAPSWTSARNGATASGTGGFSAYDVTTVSRWADPTGQAFDENGRLTRTTQGELLNFWHANPLFRLQNDYNERNNRQILSTLRGEATFLKDFYVASTLSGNLRFNNISEFRSGSVVAAGSLSPPPIFNQGNSRIRPSRAEEQRLVWESQLGFRGNLSDNGKHALDAFVGYSTELTKNLGFAVTGNRIIDENFSVFNSNNIATTDPSDPEGTTQIFFSGSESIVERSLISYLGRARYSYDGKYFLTVAVRSDGSSRFGADNRFATFPSLALAWRVSDEPWLRDNAILSTLRLEGSVGLSGSNTVADYRYQGRTATPNGARYVFGGSLSQGRVLQEVPNFNLGWEETEQIDLGIQAGAFNDRINLRATLYQQTTTGLLFGTPIPNVSGFGSQFDNVGEIRNRGLELGLNAQPIRREKFVWNVDANVSVNRNKVISLGPGDDPTIRATSTGQATRVSWTVIGDQVAQYYGLQQLGLFTQEQIDDPNEPKYPGATVGSPRFVDGDGDGVLERGRGEENDFVKIGNPWPDFVFGLNTSVSYGAFSLQVLSHGEVGAQVFDLQREIIFNTEGVFNTDRGVLDRFRVGDTNFESRPPTTVDGDASNTWRTRSSANVLDASFWRFSNVTFGYDLSAVASKLNWLNGGRIYASVQNAFLFTEFPGNPQIQRARAGSARERNIRYGAYPSARTYTVGTTLNF